MIRELSVTRTRPRRSGPNTAPRERQTQVTITRVDGARSHVHEGTAETIREAIANLGTDERDADADHMPDGAIRWRAETDKVEHAHIVLISRTVRDAIDAYLARNPRLGEAWLFPAPKTDTAHIDPQLAGKWLIRAEKLAGLRKLSGTRWHLYRRLWANERKGKPIKDVAAAGGWTDTATLAKVYVDSDSKTMQDVVHV